MSLKLICLSISGLNEAFNFSYHYETAATSLHKVREHPHDTVGWKTLWGRATKRPLEVLAQVVQHSTLSGGPAESAKHRIVPRDTLVPAAQPSGTAPRGKGECSSRQLMWS